MGALSIIVPVLEEGPALAACLARLQPLRAAGAEVIVVDGGSRDDTLAHTEGADRVLTAPRGRGAQMNAGAAVARGAVLMFLHADTRLPAGADAAIRRALGGRATRDKAWGKAPGKASGKVWGRFDVRIEGRSRWLPVIGFMMGLRSRLTGVATGDQAVFVTREAFAAVGGYPDIALMEDLAFSDALLRRVGRPACLSEKVVTSGRRWDTHGAWRTILTMWRLRTAYRLGADPVALARRYGYRPREDDSAGGRA